MNNVSEDEVINQIIDINGTEYNINSNEMSGTVIKDTDETRRV